MNKYVVLLRGINGGGNHKVPMVKLKETFEAMGFSNVLTYVNTGNVIFESAGVPNAEQISAGLVKEFGFEIPTLLLSGEDVLRIGAAIPKYWSNSTASDPKGQKSDVAFLFAGVDSPGIIKEIKPRPEIETIRYVPGALLMNVGRKNQSKSSLQSIIGTEIYKQMTIRNVNTARKLAELVAEQEG